MMEDILREQAAYLVSRADALRAQADTIDRQACNLLQKAGLPIPHSYRKYIP